MKKIFYIVLGLMITTGVTMAQSEVDALRFSQNFSGGTARSLSMGGAFGALGGDFSSLSINPAGIGVYRATEFTFTPTLFHKTNNADYLDKSYKDFNYNFNLNNMGLVFAYGSDDNPGWKSVNFGFGYNRMNNFHSNSLIKGTNPNNSLSDYFAELANGTPYAQLEQEGLLDSYLAWEYFLVDPAEGENQYQTALANYGQLQRHQLTTDGSIGEYVLSAGANYNHQLYVGASIGIQTLRYDEHLTHIESDPDDKIVDFNEFTYNRNLDVEGTGANFKFGFIFKPVEWVRLGGAIHTPTFFELDEKWSTKLETSFLDTNRIPYQDLKLSGGYSYSLTTPFKAIGSFAFIIKKQALLSIDYEFVDYTTMRLRADDYDFDTENEAVQTSYHATGNIKAGLEYKYNNFSFRGGYALYGSPYESSQINKDAYHTSYSAGIGLREKEFFFDVAYVYTTSSMKYYMYDPSVVVNTPEANIESNFSKILFTVGFRY